LEQTHNVRRLPGLTEAVGNLFEGPTRLPHMQVHTYTEGRGQVKDNAQLPVIMRGPFRVLARMMRDRCALVHESLHAPHGDPALPYDRERDAPELGRVTELRALLPILHSK